ncbi:MAG: ABC transporter substrate-binding protein [Chloroflexota bacterium]
MSIAYIPTTAEGGLFVAAGKGYLRQNGIDGQLIKANSGPDVLPQVGTGQVDVAGIGITAGVFSSIARGVNLRIVADLAAYPKEGNPLPFLVRKALYDSGQVRSAKDVKGRKVALNAPGGINEYEWVKLLAKYGLTLNDVQTTFMGIPDEIVAYRNGAIDAGILAEPNASQAVTNGDAVMIPEDSNPIPGAQGTYLVFSSKLIQERPDVAKRFLIGYVKAMRDLNANPASPENVKVQADILGFSDAIIRQQLGASVFPPDAKVDMASLTDEEQVFMQRGELKELTAPLPADKLVDSSFLDAALKTLGPA